MGVVGCYSMDLYCDSPATHAFGSMPWQVTGDTEARCLRAARRKGWIVNPHSEDVGQGLGGGRALCPLHSGKKPKAAAPPPREGEG